jgi:hypothetical protein
MLAIGSVRHARRPYQAGLNLRFLGLKLDERDRAGTLAAQRRLTEPSTTPMNGDRPRVPTTR